MSLFSVNLKQAAAKEAENCRRYLFKAEGDRVWAEAMIAYNTKRIAELEKFLELPALATGSERAAETATFFAPAAATLARFSDLGKVSEAYTTNKVLG